MKLISSQEAIKEDKILGYFLSNHARKRMKQRAITREAISNVLIYGRLYYVRGCQLYVIGRKEISENKKHEIDIEKYSGTHVLCSKDNAIITCYRSKQLNNHYFYKKKVANY